MSRFSERFKTQCVAANKTQLAISKDLGVTPQSVSQYTKGRETDFDTLIKIAKYFGVTTDYLLGLAESTTAGNQDVGARLGLNDASIKTLEHFAQDFTTRTIMNAVLSRPELLEYIIRYIAGFLEDERKHSRFRDIPMLNTLPDGYSEMNLVRFIELLPRWKDATVDELRANPNIHDELLLEYISNYVDEAMCSHELGNGELIEFAANSGDEILVSHVRDTLMLDEPPLDESDKAMIDEYYAAIEEVLSHLARRRAEQPEQREE